MATQPTSTRPETGLIIFAVILVAFVFLRSFQLTDRLIFGWDQVRDAWVMKDMFVNGRFPLAGPTVRGNTVLGPAYYYLLAPFYFLFRLDPIASGVFAVVMGVATLAVLFFTVRRLFTERTALIASFIYTVSNAVLTADRVPWNVTLLPMDAMLVFYLLVRIVRGDVRLLPWLALAVGFGFHLHFTAVFFVFIVLGTLPFIVRQKGWLRHSLVSIAVFAATFIPYAAYLSKTGFAAGNASGGFFSAYYHGFHLRRMIQLFGDAFIQLKMIMYTPGLRDAAFLVPGIFVVYVWLHDMKAVLATAVVSFLWFLVPWLVMTVYGGEITDYYFLVTRPVAVLMLACLLDWLLKRGRLVAVSLTVVAMIYAYVNIRDFVVKADFAYPRAMKEARSMADRNAIMAFTEGAPETYLFNYYTKWKHLNDK